MYEYCVTMEKEQAFLLLKKSIQSLANLPEELPKNLFDICRLKKIAKRQHFIRAGDFPEHVVFNLNGILRLYYIDNDGNDYTKGFSTQ